MISYLLRLFDRLEQNGIRASAGEKLDTLKSILYIDLSDKKLFINTIISNLAHNRSDIRRVYEVFEKEDDRNSPTSIDFAELSNRISKDTYFKYEIIKKIISDGQFEKLLQLILKEGNLTENNQFSHKLYHALIWEKTETDFIDELFFLARSDKRIRERLEKILKRKKVNIKSTEIGSTAIPLRTDPAFIPFSEIDERDLQSLKRAIRITTKNILRKIHRSRVAQKSRILNIHRTIRSNSIYENIPFVLRFKRQKKKSRNLIILCDMSESVRNSAFIMLTFINELSLLFKDVKSFAFVNDITDITRIVQKRDLHNIISDILSGGVPNLFGNSNYTIAFYKFFNQYSGILKRDTIVIIIGDGRNNYNIPDLFYLNNIRKKVHRLYWFVPESRRLWGTGDSQLPLYQTIVDKIFETCNIHQLGNAIMNISS